MNLSAERDQAQSQISSPRKGLVFEWASGGVKRGAFTLSLHPAQGEYRQILIDVPWVDDVEEVVTAAVEALRHR